MSLDRSDPALGRALGRLSPYFETLLERAAERALRLHAARVALEHLVGAAVEDEDSAAYAAVEHAFADPETLSSELLALSPGIMVVGSGSTLPFSPLALVAIERARGEASRRGEGAVDAERLARHARDTLPEAVRRRLDAQGWESSPAEPAAGADEAPRGAVPSEGPLFRHFTEEAKRALSRASHAASRAREPSIGPARLLVGALEAAPGLERTLGLAARQARAAVGGETSDASAPAPRELATEPGVVAFLASLPEGGDSIQLLLACHGERGSPELSELLQRHKVTRVLLERAAGAFSDPDVG